MPRATVVFLFLALVLLAVARWIVDGAVWLARPRNRAAGLSQTPRPAPAK